MEQTAHWTPLWPAGHLPLKGGDQPSQTVSPFTGIANGAAEQAASMISPLEGEMAGRPEGGGGSAGRPVWLGTPTSTLWYLSTCAR